MKSALLLNVVVSERAVVLKLLSCKDEALLIRGNSLLVLDLLLDLLDRVRGFNLKGNGLASKGLHENLHVVGFWIR